MGYANQPKVHGCHSVSVMQTHSETQRLKELLEAATSVANVGIWDWDLRTGELYWNPTLEAIYGLTPGSVRSYDDFKRCVHPDDRTSMEEGRDAAVSRRQPFTLRFRIIRPDGAIRWIESKGRAFDDADGKLINIIGTNQDITDRENIAQALRVSEERYRSVVEDQTEVISRFLPDGTFLFVNEVYCRVFGQPYEEIIGKRWHPIAHADDLSMIEAKLREMAPESPVVVIENRVYVASGELRWMQFVNRGFYSADGVLKEIQAVGRDITERKLIELALNEKEARLEMALAASGLGIWDTDPTTGRVKGDQRISEMLGYSIEELSQMCFWRDLQDPGDVARFERDLSAHLRGDSAVFFNEQRMRHKDGHWVTVQARGKVVERDNQGQPLRIIGTLLDVTHSKRLNEEGIELLTRIESLIRDASLKSPARKVESRALDSLTKRERQILVMIAEGMTSAQIGEQLHLATNTIISHRKNLMSKLDLHTTAEVTRFAMVHGLLKHGQ